MRAPFAPLQLLVRNASEVLTLRAPPGGDAAASLGPVPRGVVGVRAGCVAYLGPEDALPAGAVAPETEVLDAQGGFVGPGFVDPHTHAVFAGDRSEEFELRNQGRSYREIAGAGGGILSTVRATRALSATELAALALPRLGRLLEHGVTCAEVKSGYGLTLKDELKMLEAVAELRTLQPVELIATLLCAHAVPPEYQRDRAGYVALCTRELIPAAARQGIARFIDVFVEEGAFSVEEAEGILAAGKAAGLIPKVHADQLSASGASRLAARMEAASADHLEEISEDGIRALAGAGVVAVLLPTATLFLRQRSYAPGRRLWDSGVPVALATNLNPGSAMSESHALALGLACLGNGLTAAEAYWAATRGGALALKLPRHGELVVGGPADLVVFSCASYRHLPYHLAVNHVRAVVKSGRTVVNRTDVPFCRA